MEVTGPWGKPRHPSPGDSLQLLLGNPKGIPRLESYHEPSEKFWVWHSALSQWDVPRKPQMTDIQEVSQSDAWTTSGFCSSSHGLYLMTIGEGWGVSKLIHLSFSSAPSSLQQMKAQPVDLSKILEPLHLSQSLTFNPEGAFNLFRSRITPSYLQEPALIPVALHLTVKFPSAGWRCTVNFPKLSAAWNLSTTKTLMIYIYSRRRYEFNQDSAVHSGNWVVRK